MLIGVVLHLRKGAIGFGLLVGGAVLWGISSGGSSSASVPIGTMVAAVTLSLLLGLAIGAGHAFLINAFKLPPFIATLATLAGLRSLAMILSENRSITVSDRTFRVLGSEYWVTIPLFLVVAGLLSLMMGKTVLGRHLYALGGNESAARLSGLPTRRLKTVSYAISGLLAALGGVLFLGNTGSANPTMGFAYELSAITAAVVGGCSLAGGVGSIRGTVLGLVLIRIVINGTGLVVEGIEPSQIEGLVLGVVVVLAVGFNQRFRLKQ
jgi:ribose/xylose/arabinose/galactoside ABC-type transport system permease subunit